MADQKISQLPAAATITGAELVELVQSGANVKSTVTAIRTVASPSALLGSFGPNSINWTMAIPGLRNGAGLATGFGPRPATWSGSSSQTLVVPSTGNATFYGAMGFTKGSTGAGLNLGYDYFISSNTNEFLSFRKVTNPSLGGFDLQWIFGFESARADQTFFIGLAAGTGTLGNTVVPSALTDMVGFGKDQGDTNLQFMVNNGAGSAAKTDTGTAFTALNQKMMLLRMTCDAAGAVITVTLTNLEAGGLTYSFTVPDAQVKNITAATGILPHIYVGTGTATATAVLISFNSIYYNYGSITE